jgi:hypothetical protein
MYANASYPKAAAWAASMNLPKFFLAKQILHILPRQRLHK